MLSSPVCSDTQAKADRGAERPTAAPGHRGEEQVVQLLGRYRELSHADQDKTAAPGLYQTPDWNISPYTALCCLFLSHPLLMVV